MPAELPPVRSLAGTDSADPAGDANLFRAALVELQAGGSGGALVLPFAQAGTAALGISGRWYNYTGASVAVAWASVSVSVEPTGASLVVDVLKNGVTIYSAPGDRPTIVASAFTSGKNVAHPATTLAIGDYLQVQVVQVGSGVAGANVVSEVGLS